MPCSCVGAAGCLPIDPDSLCAPGSCSTVSNSTGEFFQCECPDHFLTLPGRDGVPTCQPCKPLPHPSPLLVKQPHWGRARARLQAWAVAPVTPSRAPVLPSHVRPLACSSPDPGVLCISPGDAVHGTGFDVNGPIRGATRQNPLSRLYSALFNGTGARASWALPESHDWRLAPGVLPPVADTAECGALSRAPSPGYRHRGFL